MPLAGLRSLVGLVVLLGGTSVPALACVTDSECGCDGTAICAAGACTPAFTLPTFPLGAGGASAYTIGIIAVLDHAGAFYSGCCDTRITAYTGESAERDASAVLCPVPPEFPTCLFAECLCGYGASDGAPFVINGHYTGVVGPSHLQYDGHAGYDYQSAAGAPLRATRDGQLCKALVDPVNGSRGQATAWDGFHTFFIDHGTVAGFGWASWYLHADDLTGLALDGSALADLVPGACAPVASAQVVATVGAFGTLVPHLHFEVRRYEALDGPEAFSAKVVDPYGWRGATPDPWNDPTANIQATAHDGAVWQGCGNGRVECGEGCDDGNTESADCCSATCEIEAAGTVCGAHTNPCADERCDGSGACVDVAAPRTGCRAPLVAAGANLRLRNAAANAGDRLQWTWAHGAATLGADFGDPVASERYRLCGFSMNGGTSLVFGAEVPAGGTCPAATSAPCWQGRGKPAGSRGFRYRDREATPDGVDAVLLQAGGDGAAKISVKARGARLRLPLLPLSLPLRVQLWTDSGACWEASYSAAGVRQHDASRFTGQSD